MALPTFASFREEHKSIERQLREYALTKWGRRLVDEITVEGWKRGGAQELRASNNRARIEFLRATLKTFAASEAVSAGSEFFFVTLSPKEFAVPFEEAAGFDQETIKSWAGGLLEGFHYIGIVEAAYYSNYSIVPGTRSTTVSWHVHAVAWGCDKRSVEAVVDAVNRDYKALIPGKRPADKRTLDAEGIVPDIIYMLKGQLRDYRVYLLKREEMNEETGEFTTVLTDDFEQKKRPLRKGDAVKMLKVMGTRTIPMLCLSGGEGAAIWADAQAEARQIIMKQNEITERLIA
ncbi:hypothetical protein [Aminobacter ciceronei]|uniref:Uncharacterized protein n=1 Tax=Aminobacter ciceronei TaxID=150723 RepID=A0ABR6CHT0_9HYPH|nr:hypothetical protein [Aminobacter ciceronei]MBA8910688.1 hypothetical protein [Aminobacter ciceronei]MBA9024474.1 hypothetical protein [Aminobacter ciceronei]